MPLDLKTVAGIAIPAKFSELQQWLRLRWEGDDVPVLVTPPLLIVS